MIRTIIAFLPTFNLCLLRTYIWHGLQRFIFSCCIFMLNSNFKLFQTGNRTTTQQPENGKFLFHNALKIFLQIPNGLLASLLYLVYSTPLVSTGETVTRMMHFKPVQLKLFKFWCLINGYNSFLPFQDTFTIYFYLSKLLFCRCPRFGGNFAYYKSIIQFIIVIIKHNQSR